MRDKGCQFKVEFLTCFTSTGGARWLVVLRGCEQLLVFVILPRISLKVAFNSNWTIALFFFKICQNIGSKPLASSSQCHVLF